MRFFGFSKDEWKWPAMCLAIRIIGVMTPLNVGGLTSCLRCSPFKMAMWGHTPFLDTPKSTNGWLHPYQITILPYFSDFIVGFLNNNVFSISIVFRSTVGYIMLYPQSYPQSSQHVWIRFMAIRIGDLSTRLPPELMGSGTRGALP